MRPHGSGETREALRRLAVTRVLDGYDPPEVAAFLGVNVCSVYRWLARYAAAGAAGLRPVRHPGPAPKLSAADRDRVLGWVRRDARELGFPTPCWTAPRLADAIARELGVGFSPRYLNAWLAARRVTPQVPEPVPREKDEAAIAAWVATEWEAAKKKPGGTGRRSASPTRRGC